MNTLLHFPLADLPVVFAVVGEHRDDPTWLLLLGEDGQHSAYRLLDGAVLAIELDDAWRLDGARPPLDALIGSASATLMPGIDVARHDSARPA